LSGRTELTQADAPPGAGARPRRLRRWSWTLPTAAAAALAVWQLGKAGRLDGVRERLVAPSRSRLPVRGIDVSHHQGSIDWKRVKEADYTFAYLKATEGADFRDTRYQQNWAEARSVGLVVGAYHFFTFCARGADQADHFLGVIAEQEHVLPLGVDVEFTGNCKAWDSVPAIHFELDAFVRRVEAARGEELIFYTALDQFDDLIPASLLPRALWIRSLWGEPSLPLPWLFWQYSDAGNVPGIEGRVDLDAFAGGWPEWHERVGAHFQH
jgi:lysozyme